MDAHSSPDETGDTGIECLVFLLGFLQIPADAKQLRHQIGHEAASPTDLVRAAKTLGAKAKLAKFSPKKVTSAPLPAIAHSHGGDFFILAAVKDGRALVQRPGQKAQTVSIEDLYLSWSGEAILVQRSTPRAAEGKFDVTWFIPALVKYRHLLRDVLAASFVLQLFALATPLFFQVVIDKVLVHRGLTTLDVLIIGFTAIIVFEALLGGLRSYVFTHTTSRVDVELGAKLYKHLLGLPMAYFEARRVGDSVARVRELETIREFLTSSAVTLIIDLLFTFVFLTVMWFYSKILFGVVIAAIVFYVLISIAITPPLRQRIEDRFHRGAESQAFLVESVTGVQTLKAAAVEPQMQSRWETFLANYVRAGSRSLCSASLSSGNNSRKPASAWRGSAIFSTRRPNALTAHLDPCCPRSGETSRSTGSLSVIAQTGRKCCDASASTCRRAKFSALLDLRDRANRH